jgi:hypothetical protein
LIYDAADVSWFAAGQGAATVHHSILTRRKYATTRDGAGPNVQEIELDA